MANLNAKTVFEPATGFIINLRDIESSAHSVFGPIVANYIIQLYEVCPSKYHLDLTEFLNKCIRYYSSKVHAVMSIRTAAPETANVSKYLSVHVYIGNICYEFRAVRALGKSKLTIRSKDRARIRRHKVTGIKLVKLLPKS